MCVWAGVGGGGIIEDSAGERERGEQSAVINSPGDIASFERVYIEVAREREREV